MRAVRAMAVVAKTREVQGWFSLEAALLFAWIDEVQRAHSIEGNVFEIGVHRGKSAILLSHFLRAEESLGVCDLFGDQGENVSRSGAGDRTVFESNMVRFGAAQHRPAVFAKPSSALSPPEIGTNHRFFHVDGGHNADEALADLLLASACTVPAGVIVLDDPFRAEWPGVTEAVMRFLREEPDFTAVVVGFNKLVLARRHVAALYASSFDDKETRTEYGLGYPWRLKVLPFLDQPLRIFYLPTRVKVRSLRVRVEDLHRSRPWSRRPVPARMIRAARRMLS